MYVTKISTSIYKLTINLQFYLRKHLLWYLRLKLIIQSTKLQRILLITKKIIKQNVYATLQQKIELDQQDVDILVWKSHRTRGLKFRSKRYEYLHTIESIWKAVILLSLPPPPLSLSLSLCLFLPACFHAWNRYRIYYHCDIHIHRDRRHSGHRK